jgi:ribonuclease HI
VRDIFWDSDAKQILSIPLREDFEDFPAWHFDNRGKFSVRSAYKLYVQLRDGPQASASSPPDGVLQWKKIWKLPCQPKISQFVWRFAHNSLPLRMNMERRGIKCNTRCVVCQGQQEDGTHLFLKCKEVKKLWRELNMEHEREIMCSRNNAMDVVREIIALGEEKAIRICCMLWRWWDRRNKINAGERPCTVDETARQARRWATESLELCRPTKPSMSERVQAKWRVPMGDKLKINVDGAYHEDTSSGGWGFVVRDSHGNVRGSGAGYLAQLTSAAHAEAEACSAAIQAAAEWGMMNIELESDCQKLVRALKSNEYDRALEGIIYKDLRIYLRANFNFAEVGHVPRDCNKIAHVLATFGAREHNPRLIWPEDVPDFVRVYAADDLAQLAG